MVGGYFGKFLRVNLTDKKIDLIEFTENTLRQYLGGTGLGARVLYDHTGSPTDPLGPENLLIVMSSPFAATPIPTSGRIDVVAKSPLTGIWGEAECGGYWGSGFKQTGYDGIILKGKCNSPSYVLITDEKVEIKDARHLWGLDTYELDERLKKEISPKMRALVIGPAGEKMARIAGLFTDGMHGRAVGRAGLGAVMGSKNIKALVVLEGSKRPTLVNREKLLESIKKITPDLVQKTEKRKKYGTLASIPFCEETGDLPIKNWAGDRFKEGALKISGERMTETILVNTYHCNNCPMSCGRVVKIDQGEYAPVYGSGPEYETGGSFGSMCLVDDLEAVAKAHELANRYGLDGISAGNAIAFAMEALEKGLITKKDLDGIELTWGNGRAMVEMLHKIGQREGFGWILGEGVKRAARQIGKGAEEFAVEVKGLEPPMHDPRALASVGLAYATHPRGACHTAMSQALEVKMALPDMGYPNPLPPFQVEGKGVLVATMQDYIALFNSLGICRFMLFGGLTINHLAEWLQNVTGWDITVEELKKTGERLTNLKRMYNVRCGISRKDDTLPPRLLSHRRKEGGAVNYLPRLGEMLNEYYEYRGWSEEGYPTRKKLKELGLTDEIKDLPYPT